MVEDDGELHIVVASPPSVFDAAVLLRTLYAAAGPRGWRLHIIGLGGKQLARLVTESRVPVSVVAKRVTLEAPQAHPEPVYLVDSRGAPAWRMQKSPGTLVVDYAGFYSRLLEGSRVVAGAGLPSKTYEAVAVLYEFLVRRRAWGPVGVPPFSAEPRSGLYLARKFLEALTVYDNYFVLEPSTVAYTLRRVYMEEGLLLDPRSYRLVVDPVEGSTEETIILDAYTRRGLKHRGEVTVLYRGRVAEVRDWRGLRYRIALDPFRRAACAAPGLCVTVEDRIPGASRDSLQAFLPEASGAHDKQKEHS